MIMNIQLRTFAAVDPAEGMLISGAITQAKPSTTAILITAFSCLCGFRADKKVCVGLQQVCSHKKIKTKGWIN